MPSAIESDRPPLAPLSAVVLAAGAASRMGHRPKCLLELDGVPLIVRLLQALREAGAGEIVLVLGHYASAIEAAIAPIPVKRVLNAHPQAGQVSSLRLGLKALRTTADDVLVTLADQPLLNSQDLRALIDAYRQRPAGTQVVQPTVQGLPGNPVVFSPLVRQQILASDESVGCRQWQAAHPSQVHAWASDNPHYRQDIDTAEDLRALAMGSGRVLTWPLAWRDSSDPV
jgi:molybdenum cofactor cytidylyltransferase